MLRSIALSVALALTGCATMDSETIGAPRKETIYAVTDDNRLLSFNGGQPQKTLRSTALTGLQPGETLHGIDYRVARGVLFGLGSSGRLYTINTQTGAVTAVGGPIPVKLAGNEVGFDFNPTVDRIRVVTDSGQNLRLHPDTGAMVDSDPKTDGLQIDGGLAYADGDANAGKPARLMAAGYTYNKTNAKITTNFAIDGGMGLLVTQGTREDVNPAVSPNTGRLYTVGALGTGPVARAALDISDLDNSAYAALTASGAKTSVLYLVNLANGSAQRIGSIAGGPVRGIAIEP
ncbi:MAG: DUF4394 domain-containing protein [Burkholderiales bacterium]|nr:DUF4394 domain-containing protein [Burkholderiales bacterium]